MVDKQSFKHIFDDYFDPLRNYIYYRCSDEEAASDIAQDVFMRIWEKRDQLDAFRIKPLLYKMANDMIISHYRKQTVQLNFEKDVYTEEESLSPQDDMQFSELKKRYASALSDMSEGLRETFLMSRNDELKYYEIAERLDISVKTVEKRISAALKLLKEKLS
ncbi:RNA polymerase sigma-70 factor [Bacteroides sp. 51]|nr:RNA polymerase sigma-70 factor [Bacteroides sp. 51]